MDRYEFIHFVLIEQKKKTGVYECKNNNCGDVLGIVKWHGPWRQYCFFPTGPAVYSTGCLSDINDFMHKLKTGGINAKLF